MDEELVKSVETVVNDNQRLRLLPSNECREVVERVEARFVEDPIVRWWWESLKQPGKVLAYEEAAAFDTLKSIVTTRDNNVILVVTDDEFPPWCAIEGSLDDLVAMLQQLGTTWGQPSSRQCAWLSR